MSIWRHVDAFVLHIFGMVTWIKLMPMTLTLKKELINEFKGTWRRLISDFRQIQAIMITASIIILIIIIVMIRRPQDRDFTSVSARPSKGKAFSKGYVKGFNGKGFKGTMGQRS